MKKKYRLKRWVVWLLTLVNLLSLVVMGGESQSMKVFIISKLIAAAIFGLTTLILVKYEVIYETK